jgi:hypothetical protein
MVTPEDRLKDYVWGLLTALAAAEAELANLRASIPPVPTLESAPPAVPPA